MMWWAQEALHVVRSINFETACWILPFEGHRWPAHMLPNVFRCELQALRSREEGVSRCRRHRGRIMARSEMPPLWEWAGLQLPATLHLYLPCQRWA